MFKIRFDPFWRQQTVTIWKADTEPPKQKPKAKTKTKTFTIWRADTAKKEPKGKRRKGKEA